MGKALVTGGAGFLGSHMGDLLLSRGHSVVAVDNLITGSRDNIAHNLDNPKFEFIEHDIIQSLEYSGQLDYIFNAASPASPVDYLGWPLETLRVGSIGTDNALRHPATRANSFP